MGSADAGRVLRIDGGLAPDAGLASGPVLLALRALKLGDLLVSVPALRGLRRAFPDHYFVLAAPAWLAPLVELVGGIDQLLPTSGVDDGLSLTGSVDVAVNLHGNGPQSRALLEGIHPLHRVGHAAPGWDGPGWLDDIHERLRWVRLVQAHGIAADLHDLYLHKPSCPDTARTVSVLHVGAAYGSRQWPAARFAHVGAALAAAGHHVVFTGSDLERERAEGVAALAGLPPESVLAGTLGLGDFAGLIAGARLLVSADTGAAHLASAYRTASVLLFGPAPAERWGPPPGPHIVLTDVRQRRGDVFASEPDPALLAVTPGKVLDALDSLGVM